MPENNDNNNLVNVLGVFIAIIVTYMFGRELSLAGLVVFATIIGVVYFILLELLVKNPFF